jgi:hypothetical protein
VRDIFETDLLLRPWWRFTCCRSSTPLMPAARAQAGHAHRVARRRHRRRPPDERPDARASEKPVGVGGVSKVELWIVPADAREFRAWRGLEIRRHEVQGWTSR